jgi:DNA-binding transcriptional MerR regulator
MEDYLRKIDILRDRVGVSYREAQEALEHQNGDVVKALVELEEKTMQWNQKLAHTSQGLMGSVRKYIHKGNETKIKVKKGDETLFEFPATVGALGVIGALASTELAIIGVLGTATAMAKQYTFEIDSHHDDPNQGQ